MTKSAEERAKKLLDALRDKAVYVEQSHEIANLVWEHDRAIELIASAIREAVEEERKKHRVILEAPTEKRHLKVFNWGPNGHNGLGNNYPSAYETLNAGESLCVREREEG